MELKELNEKIDRFVEVLLGKEESRLNMKGRNIVISDPKTIEQFKKIINNYKILLVKKINKYLIIENDTDLLNKFFSKDENKIYLGIEERHPLDVIRTLAHELVHFKQGMEHRLDDTSGNTGSPIENEAHEVAGIIMRNFNKRHPEYFKLSAVDVH